MTKSRQFIAAWLTAFLTFGGASAQTDEVPAETANLVYDDIPASWDDYRLDPESLEQFAGDDTRKLCLDDDFIKHPHQYEELTIRNPRQQTGKSRSRGVHASGAAVMRFTQLKGGADFIVVGEEELLLRTPETGAHLISTRYCRKSLRRAKYIQFRSDIQRSKPTMCLQRNRDMSILTRYKSGADTCRVSRIQSWSGPFVMIEPAAEDNRGEK